ncbi:MAG: hypothetical protein K2U26_18985 [Cyclobacteriaceae bacterium]|nr:hypothetical protein [Cyclobacteriaceae bacterium]
MALKKEVQQLLESEKDPDVLAAIHNLLVQSEKHQAQKEKMISRALRAEQDILSGHTYTLDEFKKASDELISRWK